MKRHISTLRGFSYRGRYRYHVRFGTFEQQKLFTTDGAVDLVRAQVLRAALENSMAVVAYCFMPDHVHLLVEGATDAADCRKFLARAKQYSGYYYSQQFHARLWQRYGFDHVLRESESTERVIRYILENPVRGKLVSDLRDYPYSGPLDKLAVVDQSG